MTERLLRVSGLRKVYKVRSVEHLGSDELVAVDGVSFEIPTGGSTALVGESGSGKSTCARIIVGLETPTDGTVEVRGERWETGRLSAAVRRKRGGLVQMVFQDPYQSLDRRQRVEDALEESLKLHAPELGREARRARMRELVDMVGLDSRQASALPRHLSGGQRQRVAIARALAAAPQLLILDEAVAALDVSIQAQVLNLLCEIRRETGVAFLFISHDLAVVRHMCDDVVVLHQGRVVEAGRADQIIDAPQADYTRQLRDSVPRAGWTPRRRVARTTTE